MDNPADRRSSHGRQQQVCLRPRWGRDILAAKIRAAAATINADEMTTNPAPAVP